MWQDLDFYRKTQKFQAMAPKAHCFSQRLFKIYLVKLWKIVLISGIAAEFAYHALYDNLKLPQIKNLELPIVYFKVSYRDRVRAAV